MSMGRETDMVCDYLFFMLNNSCSISLAVDHLRRCLIATA